MEALRMVGPNTLRWTRSGRRKSQLESGDQVVAKLEWAKSCGSLATAQTADGSWTFKRIGFLRPRITIREDDSETNLAVLSMDWTGGWCAELFRRRSVSSEELQLLALRMEFIRFTWKRYLDPEAPLGMA